MFHYLQIYEGFLALLLFVRPTGSSSRSLLLSFLQSRFGRKWLNPEQLVLLQMFLHLRCAGLEKGGKLPLSLMSLFKGSLTDFPLWKVCTVKKGQSKTLQGQSVCSELSQFVHSLSPHTAGHWSHSSLHSPHSSSFGINARGMGNAHPRAGFGPQPGKKWKFSLSLRWDRHCQAQAKLWGAWEVLGRVWQWPWAGHQSLASPAHEKGVGHRDSSAERERRTQQNSLKSGLRRLCLTGDQLPPECSS